MDSSYLTIASLSDLGSSTVRLAFTSARTPRNKPRMLSFKVAPRPEGKGGEATVFKVEPSGWWKDADYEALNIPRGAPMVARFSSWSGAGSPRRTEALSNLIKLQRASPGSMAGMVKLHGFGKVDRINTMPVHGVMIHFDLMAFAGQKLEDMIGYEPGKRWLVDPGLAAAAMVPAAKALAAVHGIDESLEGHSVATAHRDIKPENLLVLWPESKAYRLATAGLPAGAVPGRGLPLVKIVDLGGVRSVRSGPGVTGTMTMPYSERWTPPDSFEARTANPSASDVWSFGASLFFATTQGSYPWKKLELHLPFDRYQFLVSTTMEAPDSPRFHDLPDALARLIKRCLQPNPAARPPMYAVVSELEALVDALGVFATVSTPTRQMRSPLAAVPRPRPRPVACPIAVTNDGALVPERLQPFVWPVLLIGLVLIGLIMMSTQHSSESASPQSSATAPNPSPSLTASETDSPQATSPPEASAPPSPDMLLSKFGIGPWDNATYLATKAAPESRTAEVLDWAEAAISPGRGWTYADMVFANVSGAEGVLRKPSFVYDLRSLTNNSSRSMTFDLGNCQYANTMKESGTGPSLVVAVPDGVTITGYAFATGNAPQLSTPACDLTTWPGPITVEAGQTWTADKDYQMVFEMPPDSDPSKFAPVGFVFKSTAGDVAFQQVPTGTKIGGLILPAPHVCGCG